MTLAASIRRKMEQDPEMAKAINIERFRMSVSAELLEAREKAGLTQKQLGDLAGMRQSAVARLEDADYDGHSLTSLWRIATALKKRIEIRLLDAVPQASNVRYADFTIPYERSVVDFNWQPQFAETGLQCIPKQCMGV
jgi:transcriptional regulator with XRE-family HTH domain